MVHLSYSLAAGPRRFSTAPHQPASCCCPADWSPPAALAPGGNLLAVGLYHSMMFLASPMFVRIVCAGPHD